MSEQNFTNPEVSTQFAEAMVASAEAALARAVAAVNPENPHANPLEVFPPATEVRDETAEPQFTADQEGTLRTVLGEFGVGRTGDLTMTEAGLGAGHAVIEGGQMHKIAAELIAVQNDIASPKSIIVTASKHRKTIPAERTTAARFMDISEEQVATTEYDGALQLLAHMQGFQALPEPADASFSYDINNGHEVSDARTGDLKVVGHVGSSPVAVLEVKRENYVDAEGKAKYRNQPDAAQVLTLVDAALRHPQVAQELGIATPGPDLKLVGDNSTPIAHITSGTYAPSRMVDSARASLQTGRKIGVATYGTARLAAIKQEAAPAPVPARQLPGEVNRLAEQVTKLRRTLEQ
jgi:hypothetical protein